MSITHTYFGFTDHLTPLEKSKIERKLDVRFNYKFIYISKKEFVYQKLQEGFKPKIKENYSNPKTLYKLVKNEAWYKINKILYRYANYILENDFLDEAKATKFITLERRLKQ